MTAIATVKGRVIHYINPDPEQIDLDDIARGLSKLPRYTGQTIHTYSVLQHSLLVADLVGPEHQLHALLHDAPEAYTSDLPSPLKEAMRAIAKDHGHESPFDVVESALWDAVCRRWDISPDLPEAVSAADYTSMLIEAPVLQPAGWRHSVWDSHRENFIPSDKRDLLWRVLVKGQECIGEWLVRVVDGLNRRKEAA